MIKLNLKGEVKEFEKGISALDVTKSISEGLARNAMAVKFKGKVVDLRTNIDEDGDFEVLTFDDVDGQKAFRHTTSHILAQAVKKLFPSAKLAIGPATVDGFYYDFDLDRAFTSDEIEKIELEMKNIVKEALPIESFSLSRKDALDLVKDEPYKIELINDLPEEETISFYKQGDFIDLCRGPHLFNTKVVKAIKLYSEGGSSGAYWKGSEKNKMLSRIYGTSFPKASELTAYLDAREEAKKRDHNKLGRELNYFTTSDIIGQGLPLFKHNGTKVIQTLQRFVEDTEEAWGYELTRTPFMAKPDLYKVSGHWDHYKDGMFVLGDEEKDDEVFALRPMTCPFQFSIYNSEQHSYKDLPKRYSETSTLFRNENSGEMHGIIRVRQFTISEGHLVVTKDQVRDEFKGCVALIKYMMKTLGIAEDVTYCLAKWDPNNKEKYLGTAENWEKTQDDMRVLLDELELKYTEEEGGAAFYGPKLDINFKNVHGKEDTIITVQIDFSLAERFNMTYIDADGSKQYPVVLHRTSLGCYERTLAMLIEKYAGAFPTWLAPTQIKLLTLSDTYNDYADEVADLMKKSGIKVSVDKRAEKIGKKIREARSERLPYIAVIGEQEAENKTLSIRSRKGEEGAIAVSTVIDRIVDETVKRTLNVPSTSAE
ncbi:MAG: threonine--tRNA ligase [Lachnospirales bacterium]